MKALQTPVKYGKSGGQEVATNEPLTLRRNPSCYLEEHPLPLDKRESDSVQAEHTENWKSVGEIAAEIARRIADKAAAK